MLQIVTCSDDSCHRIWRVGYEHKIENEEVQIRGHAEVVSNKNPLENLKLETTPTVSRRWVSQERTPGSDTTPSTLFLRVSASLECIVNIFTCF